MNYDIQQVRRVCYNNHRFLLKLEGRTSHVGKFVCYQNGRHMTSEMTLKSKKK